MVSAAPADIGAAGIPKIRRVKLADAVIGQARALAYRTCPRLVADHPERQLELAALARIAVVSKSHKIALIARKYPYIVLR